MEQYLFKSIQENIPSGPQDAKNDSMIYLCGAWQTIIQIVGEVEFYELSLKWIYWQDFFFKES